MTANYVFIPSASDTRKVIVDVLQIQFEHWQCLVFIQTYQRAL
jgi:hypothetical protein